MGEGGVLFVHRTASTARGSFYSKIPSMLIMECPS